ncbi:MAG TPA: RluA family pseudouridine synthase [Candidatus Saccharimonadales bacterium]|nr:RluA family pseudouridine synthase [Candidatus Saccharimonadales bacterium]
MTQYTVSSDQAKQRLDVFIGNSLPSISRSYIQKLIDTNKIIVDGVHVKAGYKLKAGQLVSVNYDTTELENIPDITLPILYEDNNCIVINKPVGVLAHARSAYSDEATVASFLRKYVSDLSGERAGIVHRLDRATSGVMICAKNSESLSWLQKQFSTRKVKKSYIALVVGHMQNDHALIDMPIERNPKAPATFRVGANGKHAKTQYTVLKENNKYSLLQLMPETGRTHQLRVHLSQLGHPIVGDVIYGGETAPRLLLHALKLEITLPDRRRKTFDAPIPDEFKQIMEKYD